MKSRGFSYIKEDARRMAREEAKPAEGLARREDGTITGGLGVGGGLGWW